MKAQSMIWFDFIVTLTTFTSYYRGYFQVQRATVSTLIKMLLTKSTTTAKNIDNCITHTLYRRGFEPTIREAED